MPTHTHGVKFKTVVLTAAEPGWFVRVTLPHGEHVTLNRFKTEAMARDWIATNAAAWLKKYRGGRYAESFVETGGPRKAEEGMTITRGQLKEARALLGLSQSKLAYRSGLGETGVLEFERGVRRLSARSISSLRAFLESAGVEFTNGGQPGVRMKASIAHTSDRNP